MSFFLWIYDWDISWEHGICSKESWYNCSSTYKRLKRQVQNEWFPFKQKRFCYDILAYEPMANPGNRPPEFLFELDDCPLQAPRCVRKVALLKVLEVFFGDFPKWDAISKWQIAWRCVSLLERWHFEIQRLAKQHTIGWRALCNHSLLRWSIAFVLSFSLDSVQNSGIQNHKNSSQILIPKIPCDSTRRTGLMYHRQKHPSEMVVPILRNIMDHLQTFRHACATESPPSDEGKSHNFGHGHAWTIPGCTCTKSLRNI